MTLFIHKLTEWISECNKHGWTIVRCTCPDEDCLSEERLCRRSYAIDKEGIIHSTYRHGMNVGSMYGEQE
jgi:hypothetical protein